MCTGELGSGNGTNASLFACPLGQAGVLCSQCAHGLPDVSDDAGSRSLFGANAPEGPQEEVRLSM